MEKKLAGKTALITGASSGIGAALATQLAELKMNLVLIARNQKKLAVQADQVRKLGVFCHVASMDASDGEAVQALAKDLTKKGIDVDVLVNNVGVGKYGLLMQSSVQDYDWMMNTNMRSTYLFTRYFSPQMVARKSGHLVFLASVAGLRGLPGEAIYCASKAAQVAFAQSLDYEMRKHKVKVSVVAPGGVKTNFAIGTGRKVGDLNLEKMLAPEDVCQAVVFCLQQSDKSRVFLLGMRPMDEPL